MYFDKHFKNVKIQYSVRKKIYLMVKKTKRCFKILTSKMPLNNGFTDLKNIIKSYRD